MAFKSIFAKRRQVAGPRRLYALYDARALGPDGDTEDAMVVEACSSEQQARKSARIHGFELACWSYRDEEGLPADNERWEWNTDSTGRPCLYRPK